MKYIIEYINNILYVAYFILIGELFLGFRRHCRKYEKLVLLVIVLIITISWFYLGLFERVIIHILSMLLIMFLYFKEKKSVLTVFYIGITSILSMLSVMFEMVVTECLTYLKLSIYDGVKDIIYQIFLLIYIMALGMYFRKKHPGGLKNIGFGYLFLFSIILLIDTGVVLMIGSFVMNDLETSRRGLFVCLYIAVVLGILVQLALLINTLLTRNIYKENEELAKQFLDSQNEHYEYLEKREEETRKFRHDIRNHLVVLGDCMKRGDYKGAEEYFDTLNEKVDALGNKISVNNGIADAIINKYYDEANEKGIKLKVSGRFPMVCHISGFDICTILSNLLSNAILAESQCGGKGVLLDIRHEEEEIYILIENDYSHALKSENGIYKTTKTDAVGHGYGLKNVKESVKKNGGHISINTDNNHFRVRISMKNERSKDENSDCG